jgi:hypothetical protein
MLRAAQPAEEDRWQLQGPHHPCNINYWPGLAANSLHLPVLLQQWLTVAGSAGHPSPSGPRAPSHDPAKLLSAAAVA